MNDRAREVLVAAALSGHRQIRRQLHGETDDDGDCALGVLHLQLHKDRTAARLCTQKWDLNLAYALDQPEKEQIIQENDVLRWDFLAIARKHK